jgi:hypothetical protein
MHYCSGKPMQFLSGVDRTIGIARATVKIGLANIAYNVKRVVWLTERAAFA